MELLKAFFVGLIIFTIMGGYIVGMAIAMGKGMYILASVFSLPLIVLLCIICIMLGLAFTK